MPLQAARHAQQGHCIPLAAENEDFRKMYELAKDEQADTVIDEIVEIPDTACGTKTAVAKAKL